MKPEDYADYVKESRPKNIQSAYDLASDVFRNKGYEDKSTNFFESHASDIIQDLREGCWNSYESQETAFTAKMLDYLIDDSEFLASITSLSVPEALKKFVETYPKHIYSLSLSTTQSRRTRAGKEFESIIEMVLLGSGIRVDTQANLSKEYFKQRGLGKVVDAVIPGVLEFEKVKGRTIILSAKTTLRERWAEVVDEVSTAGSGRIYLATVDDTLSKERLKILTDKNITLVVPKNIKINIYNNDPNIYSFEEFIQECKNTMNYWDIKKYSDDEKASKREILENQLKKHQKGRKKTPTHPFTHSKLTLIKKFFA